MQKFKTGDRVIMKFGTYQHGEVVRYSTHNPIEHLRILPDGRKDLVTIHVTLVEHENPEMGEVTGLPKWAEERQFTDRNWAVQMDKYHDALQIALEALQSISKHQAIVAGPSASRLSVTKKLADDAMRRIEELGK